MVFFVCICIYVGRDKACLVSTEYGITNGIRYNAKPVIPKTGIPKKTIKQADQWTGNDSNFNGITRVGKYNHGCGNGISGKPRIGDNRRGTLLCADDG